MRSVYLDNNATTPVDARVLEAMMPYYTEYFGNPSSLHKHGSKPATALREAREQIAALFGCRPGELIFTSCGTESNNLAIRGVLEATEDKKHIVTSAVEHSAVLNVFKRMEPMGYEITILGVDAEGQIDLDDLRRSLRDDTALVSIMYANNETGVLFPIHEIAEIVKSRGVTMHVDTVQVVGKLPLNLGELQADLVSVSGHKLHAPKGVGTLFMRRGTRCRPFLIGGTQERGRRPGTENVAGIVGLGKACELAADRIPLYQTQVQPLRDKFEQTVLSTVPGTHANGTGSPRTPNTSNIRFDGLVGEAMLLLMDEVGICASAGSACKSGAVDPSHVLSAMGLSPEQGQSSVRFSLCTMTGEEDVDYALKEIPRIVERMRENAEQTASN